MVSGFLLPYTCWIFFHCSPILDNSTKMEFFTIYMICQYSLYSILNLVFKKVFKTKLGFLTLLWIFEALTKYNSIRNYNYCIILLSTSLKMRKVPRHWETKPVFVLQKGRNSGKLLTPAHCHWCTSLLLLDVHTDLHKKSPGLMLT